MAVIAIPYRRAILDDLRRALSDVADRMTNPRLRFVGYTGNERLDRRTAVVYGDDIGLSAARARRTRWKSFSAELTSLGFAQCRARRVAAIVLLERRRERRLHPGRPPHT